MTEKELLDREFRRGYYLAVANMMRLHGCEGGFVIVVATMTATFTG